ncbi:MAG: hypothetical protein R2754_12875 [Microthrixaceae bacterium]
MDCIELDEVEGRLPSDPGELAMADLRQLRNELQQAESGLSYVRRVLQGRLDIVADARARMDGRAADDLVAALSATLARNTHSGGSARPPQNLNPPAFAEQLLACYERTAPHDIGGVSELTVPQLDELLNSLAAAEAEVSTRRRRLHASIDALQAETVRRYRVGESSVDDLLEPDG